jgi:hypothetical protein
LIHPKIKEKEKQSRKTILESVSKSGSKNEKSSEKIQYWSPVLLTKKKKKNRFQSYFRKYTSAHQNHFLLLVVQPLLINLPARWMERYDI